MVISRFIFFPNLMRIFSFHHFLKFSMFPIAAESISSYSSEKCTGRPFFCKIHKFHYGLKATKTCLFTSSFYILTTNSLIFPYYELTRLWLFAMPANETCRHAISEKVNKYITARPSLFPLIRLAKFLLTLGFRSFL